MSIRKPLRWGFAACIAIAGAMAIRAWAEGPLADTRSPGDQLARDDGPPPRDGRRPPPDDRRGPPRDGEPGPGSDRRDRDDGPGGFDGRSGLGPRGDGPRENARRPRGGPDADRADAPPRPEIGMLLPPFARERLKLSEEQKKQLADLHQDVRAKLKAILTADQVAQLEEEMRRGPTSGRGPDALDDRDPARRGPDARGPEDRGPPDRGPQFRGPGDRAAPSGRGEGFRGGPRPDGPPPRLDDGDGERRGPPPREGERRGSMRDGERRGPPPDGRRGPPPDDRPGPPDDRRRPPNDRRADDAEPNLELNQPTAASPENEAATSTETSSESAAPQG